MTPVASACTVKCREFRGMSRIITAAVFLTMSVVVVAGTVASLLLG